MIYPLFKVVFGGISPNGEDEHDAARMSLGREEAVW
jgi:hypothetical protein